MTWLKFLIGFVLCLKSSSKAKKILQDKNKQSKFETILALDKYKDRMNIEDQNEIDDEIQNLKENLLNLTNERNFRRRSLIECQLNECTLDNDIFECLNRMEEFKQTFSLSKSSKYDLKHLTMIKNHFFERIKDFEMRNPNFQSKNVDDEIQIFGLKIDEEKTSIENLKSQNDETFLEDKK